MKIDLSWFHSDAYFIYDLSVKINVIFKAIFRVAFTPTGQSKQTGYILCDLSDLKKKTKILSAKTIHQPQFITYSTD